MDQPRARHSEREYLYEKSFATNVAERRISEWETRTRGIKIQFYRDHTRTDAFYSVLSTKRIIHTKRERIYLSAR